MRTIVDIGRAIREQDNASTEAPIFVVEEWRHVSAISFAWCFVTASFTRKGCEEYLRANGHNLGRVRIFAHGSHRNEEWRTVRKHLMGEP